MIDCVNDWFDLQLECFVVDIVYGFVEMLVWLDECQIIQYILVFDKIECVDGIFLNIVFSFDFVVDEYICFGGWKLKKYWCDIGKE